MFSVPDAYTVRCVCRVQAKAISGLFVNSQTGGSLVVVSGANPLELKLLHVRLDEATMINGGEAAYCQLTTALALFLAAFSVVAAG